MLLIKEKSFQTPQNVDNTYVERRISRLERMCTCTLKVDVRAKREKKESENSGPAGPGPDDVISGQGPTTPPIWPDLGSVIGHFSSFSSFFKLVSRRYGEAKILLYQSSPREDPVRIASQHGKIFFSEVFGRKAGFYGGKRG